LSCKFIKPITMYYRRLLLITTVAVLAMSCRKEGCTDPAADNYSSKAQKDDGSCTYTIPSSGYDIPSTYTFIKNGSSSVNYQGQLDRLDMLAEMVVEMKKGNTLGTTVNSAVLKNMFDNQNSPFTNSNLNASTKNLSSKCYSLDVQMFYNWIDSIGVASMASDTAVPGRKGVLVTGSGDPTKGYLVDENGFEYTQAIEKGLMGAVFYYQAMETYLSTDISSDDNASLVSGKNYTEMEHHFDEAFGYFGVPVDFPSVTTIGNARYHGKYCNSRNNDADGDYAGINKQIMDAFLKGRAAIVAKEYSDRDAAIKIIQDTWEQVIGATAHDYLLKAKYDTNLTDRMHHLSEGIAFMMALKYKFNGGNSMNPPISDYSHVQMALAIIGPSVNLYNVTNFDIDAAIGHLLMAFPGGQVK